MNRRFSQAVLWIIGILCAGSGWMSGQSGHSISELPGVVCVARGAENLPPPRVEESVAGAAESAAQTGTIEGEVIFMGQPPVAEFLIKPGEAMRLGPVLPKGLKDESLLVDTKGKTQGIANVVIYLQKAPPGYKPVVPVIPAAFSQNGFRFHPHVLAVQTGQPLEFTNLDTVAANIHSYDISRNPAFNRVVPAIGVKVAPIPLPAFRKPERLPVSVKSDLYLPMNSAYLVVLDHPFVGITDEFGKFKISNLPVGTYEFVVWHEKAGYLNRKLKIDVVAGKSPPLKLKFPSSKFGVGMADAKPVGEPGKDPVPAAPVAAVANTGRLEGQITVEGDIAGPVFLVAPGARLPAAGGIIVPFGILNEKVLVDSKSKGLANVVIYLQKPPEGYERTRPLAAVTLEQNGFQFVPHVMALQVGQKIKFANRDAVDGNVHLNPTRNLPVNFLLQPAGAKDPNPWAILERPERLPISVTSDVHPWMKAYIVVQDHPFCAVTDETGRFSIPNLPAGTHRFIVWHEAVGYLARDVAVTITAGKTEKWPLNVPAKQLQE